ncbi:MAG: hypothetical protein PVH61_13915 [Candidatus Aminicenantes bacterium]|jgi:hypothetical protein
MKNKKSFWNFKYISLFLAICLLVAVIVNFEIARQVKSPFGNESNLVQQELSAARQENSRLKAENKALTEEAAAWTDKYFQIKHFLGDMRPEVEAVLKLSKCVNCWYVALDIVKMGPRFEYFKDQIDCFLGKGNKKTITITSPNGGEVLTAGDSFDITWDMTYIPKFPRANVKIKYSTNNGKTWTILIPSTPNDGSYSWTVPNVSSRTCLVRICDAFDLSPSDISDAVFCIVK